MMQDETQQANKHVATELQAQNILVANEAGGCLSPTLQHCVCSHIHGVIYACCSYHRSCCNVPGCSPPGGLATLQLPVNTHVYI